MEYDSENLVKKICRTCLRIDNDENLCYLFPKEGTEEVPVPDMIAECTNFPIKEGDEYPNQICKKCIEYVKIAYNFKKNCEKSYQILTNIIEKCRKNTNDSSNFLESIFVSELHCLKSEETATQTEVLLVYPCENCGEKFFTFENLKNHIKENHEALKCRICSKVCTKLKETETEPSVDSECILNDDGVCKSCSDFYSQSEELNNFEESEENKDGSDIPWQYMCAVCTQTFSSEESLKHHPCEENCNTSIKSERSGHESSLEEPENPLGEAENFHLSSKILNSDTESFDVDNDDQGDYSSGDDSKPLSELQGKAESSGAPSKDKRGKKYKKINKRGRIHKCDICHKVFSRSTHLRRHILTHSDVKPYSCKVCNKGFTRLDHLNVHMHNHSDTKPHVCDICQRGFTRAENLRNHKEARHGNKMKTPKTEFCDICKKGFTTVKYLHIHMRSHTDRIWACKVCPEKFKTKPELTAHTKIHAASEKPFLCSECGLRFVRNDYLVIHMRRHKGEKPYKCKYCGKGFPRATDLTVHERYHTGEKTHLCTICGKGFQRAYNLLVHTRVHTGERPYQCPHCSKRFAQGNDLKAHIRRHTGERFKCDICGDGFIQGYHLTQHKRNVHGVDMKSHIRRVEKFVTPVEQQKQMESLQFQLQDEKPEVNHDILSTLGDADKNQPALAEVEIIKIEDENMDVTEAISLSAEQAEMLESGQEITVVDGDSVTMISYFNAPEEKVKFDSTTE